LQLRQLDLHLGFTRARTRREDVENQLGAVHYPLARRVFDVLALRWRKLVVEDDQRRVPGGDLLAQLVDFSLAEVGGGIRLVDLLSNFTDDDCARGIDEALELFEMLANLMPRVRSLARRANQNRALDRRAQLD
jgi:hypothetical protein